MTHRMNCHDIVCALSGGLVHRQGGLQLLLLLLAQLRRRFTADAEPRGWVAAASRAGRAAQTRAEGAGDRFGPGAAPPGS
jgi:hypothetical protein